jgi:4-carboxy-3-alkylbut-2-enoyl-[acp] decarboxylase
VSEIVTTTELGDGVFQLTLDDPLERNRISERLCLDLIAALDALGQEATLKVVVLAGSHDVFVAGATLEMLHRLAGGEADAKDLLLPERLIGFRVPIVAALEGHAVGGGLTLGLCCDVIVAAAERRYGANFATLGFTPGMGTTALLPALVGHHFASEMLLTGRFYKGRELTGRGLFNHVLPSADVLPAAIDIARQIADKPTHVIELIKATLSRPRRRALVDAVACEHLMHRLCFDRPETVALLDERYLR